MSGEERKDLANAIADAYIRFVGQELEDEIEYLLESAETGWDEFFHACRIVFGTRYHEMFLSAQNICFESIIDIYKKMSKENIGEMSESEVIDEVSMCYKAEGVSALCVYALKQEQYSAIESVVRKDWTIQEYAKRLYKWLDPDTKFRSFLAYMQRDHVLDDYIYFLHANCSYSFFEIGNMLKMPIETVREKYWEAERIRV